MILVECKVIFQVHCTHRIDLGWHHMSSPYNLSRVQLNIPRLVHSPVTRVVSPYTLTVWCFWSARTWLYPKWNDLQFEFWNVVTLSDYCTQVKVATFKWTSVQPTQDSIAERHGHRTRFHHKICWDKTEMSAEFPSMTGECSKTWTRSSKFKSFEFILRFFNEQLSKKKIV